MTRECLMGGRNWRTLNGNGEKWKRESVRWTYKQQVSSEDFETHRIQSLHVEEKWFSPCWPICLVWRQSISQITMASRPPTMPTILYSPNEGVQESRGLLLLFCVAASTTSGRKVAMMFWFLLPYLINHLANTIRFIWFDRCKSQMWQHTCKLKTSRVKW